MSSLLVCDDLSIFFGVEFVKKNIWVTNAKIVKPQRKSSKSKNELFREMVNNINDRMAIDYVLADS